MGIHDDMHRLRALSGAKWQRYDDDVIPAWVADMDYPTAPPIIEALSAMVGESDFGYNACSFDESVPAAWARWSSERFGWTPDTEKTRVFSTALQPIAASLSVATQPADGVVLFTPVYPPFFNLLKGSGRRLVDYRLDRNGWRIGLDALRTVVDDGTRAIVLCNPHNPSGRAFSADELTAVATVAEERDLLVVSDEIWHDVVYPGARHVPIASLGDSVAARTVTVTSASKSFSLGGLTCAVAHLGHAGVAQGIAELAPYLLGGINALGARATIEAWTHGGEWLERTMAQLHANRDRVVSRLAADAPEVAVTTPEATYLAWLDFRQTALAADPAEALLRRGRVALSPGPDFGESGAGFARLNFATTPAILEEILDRIVAVVREDSR